MAPISGPVTQPKAGSYPAAVAAFTLANCAVASRTICTRLAWAAWSLAESPAVVPAASSGPAAARLLSNPKRRMHMVDLRIRVIIGFSLKDLLCDFAHTGAI